MDLSLNELIEKYKAGTLSDADLDASDFTKEDVEYYIKEEKLDQLAEKFKAGTLSDADLEESGYTKEDIEDYLAEKEKKRKHKSPHHEYKSPHHEEYKPPHHEEYESPHHEEYKPPHHESPITEGPGTKGRGNSHYYQKNRIKEIHRDYSSSRGRKR